MSIRDDFELMIDLAAELEGATIAPRVRRRIATGYEKAVEKILTAKWRVEDIMDVDRVDLTLARHAERGVRAHVE